MINPELTIETRLIHRPIPLEPDRRRSPVAAVVVLGALALSACSAHVPPQAPEPTAAPEPQKSAWPEPPPAPDNAIVHAEFQTSAQAIKAGGKFLVAVRFAIQSGYRISWQNPGDVGKSTHVEFQVPEGFSVGPLQYPAPQRFELPGKLVNYGYENETAIFAEVTAPEHLSEGHAFRFDVKADWLACEDDCATEELNAWFELVSSRSAPEPELPDALAVPFAAIPQAFADLPKSDLDWKGGHAHPALTLRADKVKWVDFFPGDGEQPKLLKMKRAGDELELKFARASNDKPMRGVAVAEVAGKTSFYDVNVPFPSE